VDLDDLSAAVLGEKTAGSAIRRHGEKMFRVAELAALLEALKTPGRVIALGGGTPTAPGAAELMHSARHSGHAHIVYLRATEQTLRARLGGADNANRPSLTGAGVLDEIGVLLNLRETLYKGLATVVVDVNHEDAGRVVEEIVSRCGA
jgi:shikimate kinase